MCDYNGCVDVVFFKQKTAYEMRISDGSSDVCSSDLPIGLYRLRLVVFGGQPVHERDDVSVERRLKVVRHFSCSLLWKHDPTLATAPIAILSSARNCRLGHDDHDLCCGRNDMKKATQGPSIKTAQALRSVGHTSELH